jgi:hypothetical protein
MPLPEIGRRSRCKACGAKSGSVQVVFGGVVEVQDHWSQ